MEKVIRDNWKRYLVSTAVTFLAGFCLGVLPELDLLFTPETLKTGAWVGIVLIGFRTGLKLVAEMFLAWYATR